jgi:squalene-hopene/tetraprenyl-beta-curcumene cyclase
MKIRILEVFTLAALSSGSLRAQDAPAVWQGTVTSGGEQRRVVLQVEQTGATWTANGVYVEFLPDWLHVDSSSLKDGHFALSVNGGKGTYSGNLSPDGSTLRGTWMWERQPASLELHRATKDAAWPVPFLYQYHHQDVTYARPSPEEAKIPFSPRLAVDYMEEGAIAWTVEGKCVACHTNGSYMVVRPLLTPQLGAPQQALREFFVKTLNDALALPPDKLPTRVEATQMVYVAAGLAIWDAHVLHRLSPETVQALQVMFKLQRPAGDWSVGDDDNNPPLESSAYQLATVAARAVANAPGWLAEQNGTPVAAQIELMKRFLREPHKMQGDYDRTDLLWTASEYPGLIDAAKRQELVDMIFAHQQIDGGWSIRTFATPEEWGKGNRAAKLRAEPELLFPQSDGHMTGLAIIALRKAGVPATDPRIQRGVEWLGTNQRASGRWWTRSLNRDGWQFITYSGTAYPLLALSLCDALPSEPEWLGSR